MSGFQHDIAGGAGGLIIAALHSPNYVAGTSGWTINKDGSVEFNNGTFRGTITGGTFQGTNFVISSKGIFFYNGTPANGNPPIFYVAAQGTTADPYGNAVTASATVSQSGTQVIQLLNGAINFLRGVSNAGALSATAIGIIELISIGSVSDPAHNMAIDLLSDLAAGGPAIIPNHPISSQLPGSVGIAPEVWHAVTLGTGLTGNIRVKILPLANMAFLDICISWTTTAASSIVCGSLPSAAYYPTVFGASGGTRQYDLGNNATPTSAVAPVRVDIGPSGALTVNIPATSAGATKCAGSIMYPLD